MELLLKVVKKIKRALGGEHSQTLTLMINLKSMFFDQGDQDEDEKLEVQVLEIKERVMKAEHADTVISRACLAETRRNKEESRKKEEKCRTVPLKQRIHK